jgi:hypothetical protein
MVPAKESPEYYRLLALVCGYDQATWKRRLMIHVAMYSDEGYMDDDSYMFMGGYVASAVAWLDVIRPWKTILDETPAVPYFSNHDFKSEAWCDKQGISKQRMPLLEDKKLRLAELIGQSDVKFFAYSRMWRSHFDEEILSHVLALKKPAYELLRDPYYFCYVRFVSLLIQHLPKLNSVLAEGDRLSPLDVFVDENGRLACKASELFLKMKQEALINDPARAELMGTAAPLDDKKTIPLQYADLHVGQLRELYSSGTITPAMRILKTRKFMPPFSDIGLDWDRGRLRAFAEGLRGLPEQCWMM